MKYEVGDLVEWTGPMPGTGRVISVHRRWMKIQWCDSSEEIEYVMSEPFVQKCDFQDKIDDRMK